MSPPRSKPSHQIEFLPRARQPKRSNSGLNQQTSESGCGSSGSGSSSSSTYSHSPPPSSQASTSSRRPRDSLAAFKSSDSLVSLRLSPQQRDGSTLSRTTSPRCVANKPSRNGLAAFKVAKSIAKPMADQGEDAFHPFEYFPPWYAAKGVWRATRWCVGTGKGKGGKS